MKRKITAFLLVVSMLALATPAYAEDVTTGSMTVTALGGSMVREFNLPTFNEYGIQQRSRHPLTIVKGCLLLLFPRTGYPLGSVTVPMGGNT